MSERMLIPALAALLILGAQPSAAQEAEAGHLVPPAMLERAESRVKELTERFRAAEAAVEARLARERMDEALRHQVDTAYVGPFRVIALSNQVATAEAYLRESWRVFESRLAGDGADATLPVAWGPTVVFIAEGGYGDPVTKLAGSGDVNGHLHTWKERVTEEGYRSRGESALGHALAEALPQRLKNWSSRAALSPDFPWAEAARVVLSSESRAVEACLQGDDSLCLDVLGLPTLELHLFGTGRSDETPSAELQRQRELAQQKNTARLRRLWTDDQIRDMGRTLRWDRVGRACDLDVSIDSCLQAISVRYTWGAVDETGNDAVLAAALELGGPGSLGRALSAEADAEIITVLESAAGESMSEILDHWRSRILDSAGDGRSRKTGALFWTAAFGLLALTSSRWRF